MKRSHLATHIDTKPYKDRKKTVLHRPPVMDLVALKVILGRSIFTPDEQKFWPARDNLNWHRRNTFHRRCYA